MARVAGYENDQDEIQRESNVSGLITYLFGENRNQEIRKEDFLKFQRDLINDLLWLEFSSYLKDQSIFGTISEEDFCHHLLSTANMTKKKKAALVVSKKNYFNS